MVFDAAYSVTLRLARGRLTVSASAPRRTSTARHGTLPLRELSLIHISAYRTSNQAHAACKEAIEAASRDHYQDNRLDTAAVDQVVQQFGYDRALYILAITVCQADWDLSLIHIFFP